MNRSAAKPYTGDVRSSTLNERRHQALLPVFAKPASIVFNGSINARIGMPNSSVYAVTKAGLISLARTLRAS